MYILFIFCRDRRLREKTTTMTLVYKDAPPGSRTRCKEDDLILAINPTNQRILHYHKVGSLHKFEIPLVRNFMFQRHNIIVATILLIGCWA